MPEPVTVGLAVLAVGAALSKRSRRGDNSAIEHQAEGAGRKVTATKITDAIGWPYWWGKGDPGTPWADGRKGVDCSGFAQMALVKLGELDAGAKDRGAAQLANDSNPVQLGKQRVGDLAYYPGHVMVVAGPPGGDGHSAVIGASGGGSSTKGNDPNARVKLFNSGAYRSDFVTYMRLRR
jgi:cell wall-associated NlpC family hydrolase